MNFNKSLVSWYLRNKRDLPWRETRDPYKIWLSEVILQQTRVNQGMAYYHKFVNSFPGVADLARADENEIMKLWQGLGYYSRARNLHEAAKTILTDFGGVFPDSYDQIVRLKGVGPYTAAAIASFAFDEPKAVLDGNVIRVLSRFFAVQLPIDSTGGLRTLRNLAEENLDVTDPATYNQAIMEFGALQCVPKNPDCAGCPLHSGCEANRLGLQQVLPFKEKKNKVEEVFLEYLVVEYRGKIWMKRRDGKGIWQGLYDFPSIEQSESQEEGKVIRRFSKDWKENLEFEMLEISSPVVHLLSHRRLNIRFYHIKLRYKVHTLFDEGNFYTLSEIKKLGVPRPVERYLVAKGWYE